MLPSRRFFGQMSLVVHALSQALAGEDAEFDLGHVQPASMLGRVVDL